MLENAKTKGWDSKKSAGKGANQGAIEKRKKVLSSIQLLLEGGGLCGKGPTPLGGKVKRAEKKERCATTLLRRNTPISYQNISKCQKRVKGNTNGLV